MDYFVKYIEAMYEEKNNPLRNETSIRRKWIDCEDAKREARACFVALDPQTVLNLSRAGARMTTKL